MNENPLRNIAFFVIIKFTLILMASELGKNKYANAMHIFILKFPQIS